MASGIAIGICLLLGVAVGPFAFLVTVPAAMMLRILGTGHMGRLIAIMIACTLLGVVRSAMTAPDTPFVAVGDSVEAVGVISSLPVAGGEFERAMLRLERVRSEGGPWEDATGEILIYLPDQRDGLSVRDRISLRWDATDVSALAPGYANYVRTQGAVGSAQVYSYTINASGPSFFEGLSDARRAVSRTLSSAFPGDPGALASGIVTGDDSRLQHLTEDAFRRTGTAHVTSVSGQNVALLLGFLSLWMRPTGRWRRNLVHGVMIVSVWVYAVMVGLEAPALRAAVVASLTIIGAYSGRKPDPLTLLAMTLGVMAMIDPWMTRSVGFWLSASASWALCSVVLPDAPSGLRRQAMNLAMGPLAASLATLPIIVWTFHEWSPIAPLANAALSPIMMVLFPVVYFFAGLALLPLPVASIFAWVPGIGLDLTLSVVERMSTIAPQFHLDGVGATGTVLLAIPCVALIMTWSRDGERWMRIARRIW